MVAAGDVVEPGDELAVVEGEGATGALDAGVVGHILHTQCRHCAHTDGRHADTHPPLPAAMKMRNVLRAAVEGRVTAVEAQQGAVVAADEVILRLA